MVRGRKGKGGKRVISTETLVGPSLGIPCVPAVRLCLPRFVSYTYLSRNNFLCGCSDPGAGAVVPTLQRSVV